MCIGQNAWNILEKWGWKKTIWHSFLFTERIISKSKISFTMEGSWAALKLKISPSVMVHILRSRQMMLACFCLCIPTMICTYSLKIFKILKFEMFQMDWKCITSGILLLRKAMICGTHLPGAWSMLWVENWNKRTDVRCRIRAGSSVTFSCSNSACRCWNIICLKNKITYR